MSWYAMSNATRVKSIKTHWGYDGNPSLLIIVLLTTVPTYCAYRVYCGPRGYRVHRAYRAWVRILAT